MKDVLKGKSRKLIFEIKGLKGTKRWLETHAVPMRNELGAIISILAVTRDITERTTIEKEKNSLLLTLENSLNEKDNFEKRFSFFHDYDANEQMTGSRLTAALDEIFERITQDIFNESLAKW